MNATVTLTANAGADPSPTFQVEYSSDGSTGWESITDAISETLQIFGAAYSDNGFYRLVATNGNGSATSDVVQVSLTYPPPEILSHPASTAVEVGTDVTFSVTASGA
mgnify:CR=1 FL=1